MRRWHWESFLIVVGAGLIALVSLGALLRGRVWAAVPAVIAAAIALREIRALRRGLR